MGSILMATSKYVKDENIAILKLYHEENYLIKRESRTFF